MVQKRCYRGEFRLRPDPVVRQILQYSLAYTADKHGIDLHEFVIMFNHDHIEKTDPLGKRPGFLRDFHSLVGRAVNAHFGDKESLWNCPEKVDSFQAAIRTVCGVELSASNSAGLA